MSRDHDLPDATVARLREMRADQGKSFAVIARALGLSFRSVRHQCGKLGIHPPGPADHQWTDGDILVLREMKSQGADLSRVAAELGVTVRAVMHQCAKYEIRAPAPLDHRWTGADFAVLREMRSQGKGFDEIGCALGVTARAVQNKCTMLGILLPPEFDRRIKMRETVERAIKERRPVHRSKVYRDTKKPHMDEGARA